MKATIKFPHQDDRRHQLLLRLKLPFTLLGLPFSSSISTLADNRLLFCLCTAYPSFPSLRLSFCPNPPFFSSPFSLSLKSPSSSPLSLSAHLSSSLKPSFHLSLKPRVSNFMLRKPLEVRHKQWWTLPAVEVTTSTVLPLANHARVRFRWGVRLPHPPSDKVYSRPCLLMDKISIEHVADKDVMGRARGRGVGGDVTRGRWGLKSQVDEIKEENVLMWKAIEEVRHMMGHGREEVKVETKAEVNEKMRKAIMEE